MYANNTIPAFTDLNSPAPFTTGQMIHYPDDTGIREVHYVVTGKDTNGMEKVLDFNTTRCTDCYEAIVEVETVENTTGSGVTLKAGQMALFQLQVMMYTSSLVGTSPLTWRIPPFSAL